MRMWGLRRCPLLNEVLSLNAQEFMLLDLSNANSAFLNEVLSLNAQESASSGSAFHSPAAPQ